MVVTKDVKAGTLLAVCNPLAIAYTDPLDMGFQFDPLTGRKNDRSQTDLITKLANVSMHNPEVLQQMYALYDGTQQSLENTPEITLFNNQLPENHTAKAVADIREIASIVQHNAFGSDCHRDGAGAEGGSDLLIEDQTKEKQWSGLYPLMSLINHSCCPNSTHYFIRDAAMLRAGSDMKTGDEVTISYKADLYGSASSRQRDLGFGWQFVCSCSRCQVEHGLSPAILDMINTLQHQLDTTICQVGTIASDFGQAVSLQRQSKFRLIARKLDRLLTELEGELARASLTQQQREWAMFTVLRAYLCRRQCFEVMFDLLRLPQISKQIAAIYQSTVPGSSAHIHEMVRNIERAECLSPGSPWQRQAVKAAKLTLQVRYGLVTKAQTHKALLKALRNNSSKYARKMVYDDCWVMMIMLTITPPDCNCSVTGGGVAICYVATCLLCGKYSCCHNSL
ncbi:hypothetical protein ABBQ32_002171 [Trebouxia sp. C0010 RCD-2024]